MLRDQVLMNANKGQSPFLTKKPDWAKDEKLRLSKASVEKFNQTQLASWPRTRLEGTRMHAEIVQRPPHDMIYQFFFPKKLKPVGTDFESLLADTVQAHFGTLTPFSLDRVEELESWALLAKNVRDSPLYSEEHYTTAFLTLLDLALDEAERT